MCHAYKKSKGGSIQMWIEEANGKYKCCERYEDYLTGVSKKVSVTIDKKTRQQIKQAEAVLQQKIAIKTQHAAMENDIALGELVQKYLVYQKREVKASTYQRNSFACASILKVLGSDTLVSRLTVKYIKQCLHDSGRENGTLNEWIKRFKALIRWGYINGYVTNIETINKLERYKDMSRKDKVKDKFLESKELMVLLGGMGEEKWCLLTEFLALSGLRIGEAVALNREDVDLKNRVLVIDKTYDPVNDIVTTTKTQASTREVYIQEELLVTCKKVLEFMAAQKKEHKYESKLLWQDKDGGYLKYYAYNKYLRENAMAILGRGKITAHVLRHTHTSLLAEKGVPLETISRRLGHGDSKITKEIYLHITDKMLEDDKKKLEYIQLLD